MLGTLFFDEARVNTAFGIRTQQPQPSSVVTRDGLADSSATALDLTAPLDGLPAQMRNRSGLTPSHNSGAFSCRGEVALSSLHATLLWWLDADTSVVKLLVMNDTESCSAARSNQSRLLSIELPPSTPGELLTCGVTRNYLGDNGVAVVWVLRPTNGNTRNPTSAGGAGVVHDAAAAAIRAGYAQVTIQREVDNTGFSALLLIPDERMVECAPLSRVPTAAFTQESAAAASHRGIVNGQGCVVAELPDGTSPSVASFVVLTDGAHLWKAQLGSDGSVKVTDVKDEPRRNLLRSLCEDSDAVPVLDARPIASDLERLASTPGDVHAESPAEEERASPPPASPTSRVSWMRRLSRNRPATPATSTPPPAAEAGLPSAVRQRLYAGLSAVQQSSYVAVTRWNGQVEVYETAGSGLALTQRYPVGILPPALLHSVSGAAMGDVVRALPAGAARQWATRSPLTQVLHVVTCLADAGDGRVCVWTSLPPLSSVAQPGGGEILAQHCTLSLAPPTLSSVPLACAVTSDDSRLILLSDIGVEEDGHLLCASSLAALALRGEALYADGVASVVQVVEADGGEGLRGLLRGHRLRGYLCHGARMQGVLACGSAVVMAEKSHEHCHLYSMEAAGEDGLRTATEGVVIGVEDEDVFGLPLQLDGGLAAPRTGGTQLPQHRVHYVPLTEASNPTACVLMNRTTDADPYALFWEGVNVTQSCMHGARFTAAVLRDVLLATTPISHIASVPQLLSEAHLSGYTASLQRSAPSTKAAILAAVRLALNPSVGSEMSSPSSPRDFYAYSRLYVTQSTMSDLLSRITFLATTYIGWQSTQSVANAPSISPTGPAANAASRVAATSSDWLTHQLISALELLVAAYHAVPVAGADLIRLALLEDDAAPLTSAAIVAALLPTSQTVYGAMGGNAQSEEYEERRSAGEEEGDVPLHPLAVVQIANRLRRCCSPRMAAACEVWMRHLTHRFPLLRHYELLSLLEMAAAPSQSARVLACCQRVVQALAMESAADVVELLLMEGMLLTDVGARGTGSAFRSLPLDELAAFISVRPMEAPRLYAVGVLRYATGVGALHTSLSISVVRRYLYAVLVECLAAVERLQRRASLPTAVPGPVAFTHLRRALEELQVDVLLVSAQASISASDMGLCFHDVQTALDVLARHKSVPAYAELVQRLLSSVVETACATQANMNALLRTTTLRAAQLEESLILRWYNYIARLPTKSASVATEALRYRAIMGLHRYLMNHHCYAQCARLMSSLATLLRCSPLRRSAAAGISVGELSAMALHAATMISLSVPMGEAESAAMVSTTAPSPHAASGVGTGSPTAAMAGSPVSLGYSWQPTPAPAEALRSSNAPRWLSRTDIPWLQRRLYQAQCERQLWRLGCTLDCTDLWVEGAPAEAYHAAAEKLVSALMQSRLWPQAIRFAGLTGVYDPCDVLVEWAVDLLREAQESEEDAAADRTAAWEEVVLMCHELSSLQNQYNGFARTVTAALSCDFAGVPEELLTAHRLTDPYTAMTTLFRVALTLRTEADAAAARQQSSQSNINEEEEEDRGRRARGGSSLNGLVMPGSAASTIATAEELRCNAWRALCGAAAIGMDILQAQDDGASSGGTRQPPATRTRQQSVASGVSRRVSAAFTAGLIDPLVLCAKEFLRSAAYKAVAASVPGAQETVSKFLAAMDIPVV